MILSVQLRIFLPHFGGIPPGVGDLNQRAFADSGAITGRLVPFPAALDQLGPKGENPALRGLGRMNRAAFRLQEMAMRIARDAQAEEPAGAVDIFSFEGLRRDPQESRGPEQVLLGQIDKAALPATFRAAALALEAQTLRHGSL